MSKTIREAIDNYGHNAIPSKTIREAIDNAAGHKRFACNMPSVLGVEVVVSESFSGYLEKSDFTFTPKSRTVGEICDGGLVVDIRCFPYKANDGNVKFSLTDVYAIYYRKPGDVTDRMMSVRAMMMVINNGPDLDDAIITGFEGYAVCETSTAVGINTHLYFVLLK